MNQQLTYRPYQPDDVPELLRLWEQETGWGSLTAETWRRWMETPYGPCLVMVAHDPERGIVGQEVFTPARVAAGGREMPALRLSAPILSRSLRRTSLRDAGHPVVELFYASLEEARRRGYGLFYALPDHAWLPIFRLHTGFPTAELPCAAPPPGLAALDRRLAVAPVTEFGPEFEALWQAAAETYPFAACVVRRPDWLRYRHDDHLVLGVRRSATGPLVGYASVKRRTGLLMDLLTAHPDDLAPVLSSVCAWLRAEPGTPAGTPAEAVKVMETPLLAPALRALGFEPVDYKFAFVVGPLNPDLPPEAASTERWWIMPGD